MKKVGSALVLVLFIVSHVNGNNLNIINPRDFSNFYCCNSLGGDSDGDGIPDSVEGTVDTDGDGTPDYLDLDSDNDGIIDGIEGAVDTDGDGIGDWRDLDSDNDGIGDGVEGTVDTDGDGTGDWRDADSDNDGIGDWIEGTTDTDGDGIGDWRDLDSDNDGKSDADEGTVDSDGDGIGDWRDPDNNSALQDCKKQQFMVYSVQGLPGCFRITGSSDFKIQIFDLLGNEVHFNELNDNLFMINSNQKIVIFKINSEFFKCIIY